MLVEKMDEYLNLIVAPTALDRALRYHLLGLGRECCSSSSGVHTGDFLFPVSLAQASTDHALLWTPAASVSLPSHTQSAVQSCFCVLVCLASCHSLGAPCGLAGFTRLPRACT